MQKKKPQRVVSARDGKTIIEMVYDPENKKTSLVSWDGKNLKTSSSYNLNDGQTILPYSATNQLVSESIVNFPSAVSDYESEDQLLKEIRDYIHRYVDLNEQFEKITSYYVFLTWIFDTFNEVPYLRLRGSFGVGKTRFLQVVGSLCYKSFLSSGASTVAPIFHLLNSVGGTLVLDEADMRFSDQTADLVKVLNNGTVKDMPVLRCQKVNNHEFQPMAYKVFGPKIIATRGYFSDLALESRFISEDLEQRSIRPEIPHTLPKSYAQEALEIRNKLLMYRFQNLDSVYKRIPNADTQIAGRLNQMFLPLLAVIKNSDDQKQLQLLAKSYDIELNREISDSAPAQVTEIIALLADQNSNGRVLIKDIASTFTTKFGMDYENKITPKWIGTIVRRLLRLDTYKSHGNYVVSVDPARLKRLCEIYNISLL